MKLMIGSDIGTYTFNPATRQIALNNIGATLSLSNFMVITNVTSNVLIYNFMNASLGATALNNNVITLAYNTTSMSSNDALQIFINIDQTESLAALLRRMNKLLESNAIVDSSLRQRVVIEAGSVAVTNATGLGVSISGNTSGGNPYSLTSVGTLNINEGPVDQRWRIANDTRQSYALGIRSQLQWS